MIGRNKKKKRKKRRKKEKKKKEIEENIRMRIFEMKIYDVYLKKTYF